MSDKIVNQLPVVLQTKAIKNFFEATVEQLYSEANITPINGFIGKKTGDEYNVTGAFITENTADRRQYNLSPAVNNTNPITGDSENLIFYDEFIDTLNVYGVTTQNHNRIFGSRYRVFMPPIDVDKFVNYQEYYWYPAGPSTIEITATSSATINIEKDVVGKKSFSYGSTTLRNGMIIKFVDNNYTIPVNSTTADYRAGVEYIVEGVGQSIYLVEKDITSSTLYGGSNIDNKDYIVIQRGAENKNAWSRVNHWYHRNNFKDAGDDLPSRDYRGMRPIIEFDKNIEMYNHGTSNYGVANASVVALTKADVEGQSTLTVDTKTVANGDILFFPNESASNKVYLYKVSGVGSAIALTATSSTAIAKDQTVVISEGSVYEGADYKFNGTDFSQAQKKIQTSQAPLFVLYDDAGNRLDNQGLYNASSFKGNKIFGYRVGTGVADSELGFALSYTPYKSVSEITFENFIQTDKVNYQTFGSSAQSTILGGYYYKLLKTTPEYHSYWKLSPEKNEQKIVTTHYISRDNVDDKTVVYNIGAVPNTSIFTASGYDILVKVNGEIVTDYVYEAPSSIKFNSFNFDIGDIIDVEVVSDSGITKISDSRYEVPLSWKSNPFNNEIEIIAEPQYLSHFKRFIERQDGFVGDALASNNFASSSKDLAHAKDIVQTDQDLILAAFLLDDQPHNLVESLRFVGREYEKYRARLIKEIKSYNNLFDVTNLTTEYILERVLRNLISFSIGKDVFGTTYVLPFGDNYIEENFDVADVSATEYTLSNYADLGQLENSLLVYRRNSITNEQTLLTIDTDYTISSDNPIIVNVTRDLELGDTIITKLYNEDRDSAECPPTPSTMGLYPLFVPKIETDNSFQTSINILVGHDGSRTTLTGTVVDDVLLEFEKRLYNTSMKQFRDAVSLPRLNTGNVRSGAFRTNNFSPREYTDLLRNSFNNWLGSNKADHVINEYFDETNSWTWNYRGTQDLPGHWRGWYEYYYDTVRPHTHPWEMLGFFEMPSWWENQYGTDYSSANKTLWSDLEQGIIRQGPRENFVNGQYLNDNPWRRVGLSKLLPVTASGDLLPPGQITDTGTTNRIENWTNRRLGSTNVTDQFKDSTGQNNLPNGINVTYGSAQALRVLFDANAVGTANSVTQAGTFWDYNGFISTLPSSNLYFGTGFVEGFDGFTTPYVYVENSNIEKTYQLYNYTFENLNNDSNIIVNTPTVLSSEAIGITVTGVPILNPGNVESWNNEEQWYYSNTFRNNQPENGTYFIEPEHAGLEEWDTTSHSPIVGWSFDGLPIYGPYGYTEYSANGSIANATITGIESVFAKRSGNRASGPGGEYSGEFVQDYTVTALDPTYAGTTGSPFSGSLAEYNMRYGVTPESPDEPIYFYVATVDENGDPMFPYVIGGTESATNTYQGKYYSEPVEQTLNNTGSVTVEGELVAISSNLVVTPDNDVEAAAGVWRFGDGAPVENAWKYSVGYPFAVAEALLLSRPGKFVTEFSDPTRITTPALDQFKIINKNSRTPFDFVNEDHYCIHGAVDSAGNTTRNVGYTQFIHSWLTYQDLNTTTDYADKVRKVNIKLAHRMAGFTDKDTLTVRADQTSLTSTSSSLIIPAENTDVIVHSSPYKNRNFYTGMMIQKTARGYKLRGYDKNFGYFEILRRNKRGQTTSVEVGGEAAEYVIWEANKSYQKGTIVSYNNAYYEAPTLIPSSETFLGTLWKRLASLPQKGAVKATLYLDSLPYVDRVDYQTEYQTYQEVVDVIVGLGAYQESLGYDFGGFDSTINDVRNWNYVVRQFLFWVAGGWETNNTLELSPFANKLTFNSTSGMIAKINRTDKNQFTLIDQDGKAIQPSECEIVREGNTIEIVPPSGIQIYGAMLFTKEIEHALVFDNVTDFNDVLFDPVYNQSQKRLKLKGKRTANWSGLFSTEGFVIQQDELRPNLDNMAQSLGRHHELGFIPVEKQIYEQARGLFGYQERTYLTNLEIEDDDQFEFYKGMLQSKGTLPSLQKIAKSRNIIQGEMTVYDEWALKVGDFGDLENDQTIELKLEKSDVIHDPQMITLAFPEDTTGVIDEVRIIQPKHKYYSAPTVEIAAPSGTPAVQATAIARLAANGTLSAINITNEGSGYAQPVRLTVVAGNLSISNVNTKFNTPVAVSNNAILETDIAGLGLSNLDIVVHTASGNTSVELDISSATSMANIVSAINTNASINSSIVASSIDSKVLYSGNLVVQSVLSIRGNDFTLVEDNNTLANLNLTPGRYEPRQRYNIAAVDNYPGTSSGATTVDDIVVTVAGSDVPSDNGNNWVYDPGSRQQIDFNISASGAVDEDGSFVYSGDVNVPLTTTLDANNIAEINGITYLHANVYVNGVELENFVGDRKYTLTTTQLTIHNVQTLPDSRLAQGANIYVVEAATVDFEPAYFGDVPGAALNIKTTTNDDIAIITKSKRLYDITEDDKNDDTILIDIDDTSRFLKKPIGVREQNLWPTMSGVDYTGITDSRYTKIPNAGYVNSSNVAYSSFDVPSIADMFRPEFLQHPDANDTVHVAISENRDWNVYKFKEANTDISFIERETTSAGAYLYSNVSLFNYTDSNQIGNVDLGRFLDYHVAIKDAIVSDRFVVWVNEEVVNQKQVRLSNITPVAMMEKYVDTIGPNRTIEITDVNPGISAFSSAFAEANIDGNGTVRIYASTKLLDEDVNSVVGFAGSNTTPLWANTYTASNISKSNSTFTIHEPALTANIDAGNLVARYFSRTQFTANAHNLASGDMVKIVAGPYSGQWQVESAGANTFCIDTPYLTNGPTTGNILLPEVLITTSEPHGLATGYAGKKVAVHNSDQKFYNRVYVVKSVPSSTTILAQQAFPFNDQTISMTANSCVVTTLDHQRISLNNSNIKIENINSLDGMIDSLNRSLELRRGWIRRQGSFNMAIPFLNSPISPTAGLAYNQIAGGTPYVMNLSGISTKNTVVTGAIPVNQAKNEKVGFNKAADGSKRRTKALPRTQSSGAATTGKTTTQNVSPYNPYSPITPLLAQTQNAVQQSQGKSGASKSRTVSAAMSLMQGAKKGAAAASTFGTNNTLINATFGSGGGGLTFGGGSSSGGSSTQSGGGGAANRFGQLLGSVQGALGRGPIIPKVTITGGNGAGGNGGSTNNSGGGILNGGVVNTIPTKPCGELVIPTPPPQPSVPISVNDDSYTTDYETQLTGNVLDNDVDPSGDPLYIYDWTDPSNGALSIDLDGSFTYVPDDGFSGIDEFRYYARGTAETGVTVEDAPPYTYIGDKIFKDANDVLFFVDGISASAYVVNYDFDQTFWDSITSNPSYTVSVIREESAIVTIAVDAAPVVIPTTPTIYEKCEYQEQSTTQTNVDDTWTYHITAAGTIKIIIDMDGGFDALEGFQLRQPGGFATSRVATTGSNLRLADNAEKDKIRDNYAPYNANNPGPGGNTGNNAYAQGPRDFVKEGGSSDRIKYCGVLEFPWDPAAGEYLRINVDKDSSVYRYVICYPTATDPGTATASARSNPNPGQPNTGVANGTSNPNTNGGASTAVLQPTGGATTKAISSIVNNLTSGNWSFNKYMVAGLGYVHNFGGFSLAPMAGYTHIPSIFKKTVKTVNPQQVGRLQELASGRYVNVTQQRATGGRVIPLAAPVPAPIPITRRGINGVDISLYPGSEKYGSSNYWGNDLIDEQVLKIASTTYDIQNISVPGIDGVNGITGQDGVARQVNRTTVFGDDGSFSGGPGSGTVTVTTIPAGPATIIPGGIVYDSTNLRGLTTQFSDFLTPEETVPAEDAPLNAEIEYTQTPIITIQPKKKVLGPNGSFAYKPAGPIAYAPIYAPTPSVTLTENDMIGLTPGDEVIINTRTITIQGTPAATLKEFECSGGFGYTTTASTGQSGPQVTISSCGAVPLTFRDGCRGGVYKEVLDFHVVKNFSYVDSTQQSHTITSEGTNTTTGTVGINTTNSDAGGNVTGTTSTTETYNTSTATASTTEVPDIGTTSNFTGGKGYKVGDRLRVVGGTPVASPFGSIAELCIEIPGLHYSSAANVKVFIGDGTTPGSEAEAGQVVLDSQGSITSIPVIAGGQGYDPARPPKVRIVDTGENSNPTVVIPAKIRPIIKTQAMAPDGTWRDTSGLPERPAKFEVTAVSPSDGSILSLKIIDRGIYKEFPADLATGVPLEYDAINLGDEASGTPPLRYNSGLGQFHPITYEKLGSPGNYDPNAGKYGELTEGSGNTYGTGAKIFLTAREIPDCSEKADVRTKLGLPDIVYDVPVVEHIAGLLNEALQNAGYDPVDFSFNVEPVNEDIDQLVIEAPAFDGVEFDELTPGFLDKLGLPPGDYNPDQTPLTVVDGTPTNDRNLDNTDGFRNVVDGTDDVTNNTLIPGQAGVPGRDGTNPLDPFNQNTETGQELPEEVMVIYGVDNGGFSSDGSTILGNADVTYVGDLYQYELRTLDGQYVDATEDARDCRVLYLESQRYSKESDIANANVAYPYANIPATKEEFNKLWLDDDGSGKWKYYENGSVKREQPALVDPKYIKNTIVYDSTTGKKDFDYDMWDPFKGVFPAFVDAEITYFSENDPVVYTARRAVFGKEQVGQVWWNTSTIRYNWYEQGPNKERWLNWGSAFPGSGITLYEWVESDVPPVEYRGTGIPKNASEFIIERNIDHSTGQYANYYYFWVQNEKTVSSAAARKAGRKFSTFDLAKYLSDPIGQGINTVSFISAGTQQSLNVASFVMSNLTKTLREDEQNIQINLSRNLNPIGLKHSSWKLLRENDNNSDVPEDLSTKLIDSLTEIDSAGNIVPADNLSEVERYGIKFRPRQTMFKRPAEARRVLHYIVNELLADIKLNTLNTSWQNSLPSTNYIETVNWYEVQRVDSETNKKIRFDNTFKAAFTVSSVKELDSISGDIADGTVVMVRASQSDRYQLWRWCCRRLGFYQIAIQNETVRLKDTIYTDEINPTLQAELRAFLYILKDSVFVGTANLNTIFFEMLKYALGEQQELDWAFKSSYIYVEKEEEDLVQRVGYKPDNFESVIEYLNEVKPYTAKIREYKDGKRAPLEYIKDQMLSDFDFPPYADSNAGEVRPLSYDFAPDREIIENNTDYTKWYSEVSDHGNISNAIANVSPVRTGNISLVFDRVDWRLLEADFNAAAKSYTVSIGDNIANINSANVETVSDLSSNAYTASARLFKFDPEIRTQFNTDIDEYFGSGASSNTSIVESSAQMQIAVAAGALNKTLYLVKEKVGGTWQGEILDANVFAQAVDGEDSLTLQSVYGYDTSPFDYDSGFGQQWDTFINVQNYEGIFKGTSTYREEGVTYDGFDGFSFNHLLYGEERPEELVYLSPLENLVMHVRTDPTAFNANGGVVGAISVGPYEVESISTSNASNIVTITSVLASPLLNNGDTITLTDQGNTILANTFEISDVTSNTFTIELAGVTSNVVNSAGNVQITSGVDAVAVEYIVHQDLFGATEYLRILTDGSTSTTTAKVINAWDTEIDVVDASVLPQPAPGVPGAAWLDHSERIEYTKITGNKLRGVTRGTRGTTIPNGPIYTYAGNVAVQGNTYLAHPSGVSVVGAGNRDIFDKTETQGGSPGFADRDPDTANWLASDGLQQSLTDITNRSTIVTISAFLQGDLVSSIGWDSTAWDSIGWDSI